MKVDPGAGNKSRPLHIRLDRLVVPSATVATALGITALFATCGRKAERGFPADDRSRAAVAVATCDAALAEMGRQYRDVAPELVRLLGSDRTAAIGYLEQHVATIVSYPVESCDSARDLVTRVFRAHGTPDDRIREDGGRLVMHAPRLRTAQDAYVALHAALRANQPDVQPLVDALADALR